MTHNNPESWKYKSYDSPKGKDAHGQSREPRKPHQGGSSYVQLSTKIKTLETTNKKIKPAHKKKHKHHDRNSNGNNSNSS